MLHGIRPLLMGEAWPDDLPGGLNRYLSDLFEGLQGLGFGARGVVLGPASRAPVGIVATGSVNDSMALRLWRFNRAAVQARNDVTVVDAHFALYAFWPVVVGKFRSVPLVVHFHGPWAQESLADGDAHDWRIRAKKLVESRVYRRASRVVVLSGAFKRLLVERYGVAPWCVEVVAPGVDLSRFTLGSPAVAREKLGLEGSRKVVVAVRRLVPRMGLDVLLEAWASLPTLAQDARLLIVGGGPERRALAELAEHLGVTASVRFLGEVDEELLVSCYQAADISVVPTVSLEGFGLIILESLACGTPVIATDVGGLPEVLGPLSPDLIVPAGDAPALAERLSTALLDPATSPGPDQCRRYAESFNWESAARKNQAIYSAAIDPPDRKPRVLFLDHCAELSGGELALVRTVSALVDVNVHVLLAQEGPLVANLHRAKISVEVLPMGTEALEVRRDSVRLRALSGSTVFRSAAYVIRLARRIRQLQPDIVHTNSLKAALYGGFAARLAGVPVVWHVRDRISAEYLPAQAVRLVRALSVRVPHAVIVNSHSTLETLTRRGVATHVIPSPVGREFFDVPRQRAREPGVLRFGVVGRLAPWKGQHLFLEAMAQAFGDGTEELVVVGSALFGETAYEAELVQLARQLCLEDRTHFAGFRNDIPAELARLDVVVHSSTIPEPFGLVVVEAMAMGLPVVAPDAGGPSEVIEDGVTGLLYPIGNVAALAKTLRRLSEDPELRKRLGAAAQDRAKDFSADSVAGRVMDVYTQVLNRPKLRPLARRHTLDS